MTTNKNFLTQRDANGVSISEHSHAAPMLLLFLRHVGCPFCRRTLREVQQARLDIEANGYTIGVVHMDSESTVNAALEKAGLADLPRFHDPDQLLYAALDVKRLPMRALFSPRTWTRGFEFGAKYGYSWPESDPMQLPGAFLIDQGQVIAGHSSLYPAEPPDFRSLVSTPVR